MTNTHNRKSRRSGFTLLEVLLVLAILMVIAGLVLPRLIGTQQESQIKAASLKIENFSVYLSAVDAVKLARASVHLRSPAFVVTLRENEKLTGGCASVWKKFKTDVGRCRAGLDG